MTPEERFERIEQKIEFIVNQQAQFSIDLQALREELRQSHGVLQKQIDQHQGQIGRLNEAVVSVVGMVGKLVEAQAKTEANLQKLEEKAAETEERLNVFIDFVKRYLSERDHGKSEPT